MALKLHFLTTDFLAACGRPFANNSRITLATRINRGWLSNGTLYVAYSSKLPVMSVFLEKDGFSRPGGLRSPSQRRCSVRLAPIAENSPLPCLPVGGAGAVSQSPVWLIILRPSSLIDALGSHYTSEKS